MNCHEIPLASDTSGKTTFSKTIAINIVLAQALNTKANKEIILKRGENSSTHVTIGIIKEN